jgi:hypothetical protein
LLVRGFVALAGAALAAHWAVAPWREMTEAARRVQRADFAARLDDVTPGDLRQPSAAFNAMAERLSALQPGEGQEVLHQCPHSPDLRPEPLLEARPLLRIEVGRFEGLQERRGRGQRGPQLVGDVGHEVGLDPVQPGFRGHLIQDDHDAPVLQGNGLTVENAPSPRKGFGEGRPLGLSGGEGVFDHLGEPGKPQRSHHGIVPEGGEHPLGGRAREEDPPFAVHEQDGSPPPPR